VGLGAGVGVGVGVGVCVCVCMFPVLMCENGIRFDRETFVNVLSLSLSFVQSLKLLHNTLSPNQELLGLVKLL